jgi:type IV pilus assembly protein PilW
MSRPLRSRGFSLVELMVAMALGLVIVGGVVSVLMANKRSYRTNEGLAQVQETGRTAYELIARDVRQSGTTGCDNARRMSNLLSNAASVWWAAWEGVHGYDNTETDSAVTTGTTVGQRVTGTDSLRLRGIDGVGFPIESHTTGSGQIVLRAGSPTTALSDNDALIICDFDHSTMFKGGTWTPGSLMMAYNITGNCSTGMGFPTNCDGSTGLVYQFQRNAWVGRLGAVDWYIGNNSRGGRSLFRIRLDSGGVLKTEEVVAGVSDMQIDYGVNGSDTIYAGASAVAAGDWAKVNSVFITLEIDSSDTNVSTDTSANSGKLHRRYTYIITMRNRVT